MATLRKRTGKWTVEIRRRGHQTLQMLSTYTTHDVANLFVKLRKMES